MRVFLALGVATLGLGGVVGLELADWAAPPLVAAPPNATTVPRAIAGPRTAAIAALPGAIRAAQATLLQRPLFSPSRRPPPAAAVAAPDRHGPPRLAGVLIAPSGRRAIFADRVVVAEGGALGRYTVQAIEAGQVTLLGPDGPQVLRPAFAVATSPPEPPPRPVLRRTPPMLAAPK